MTRGKQLKCPSIVIVQADAPKHATRAEAWSVVGPVVARIVAQTITREKAAREPRAADARSG